MGHLTTPPGPSPHPQEVPVPDTVAALRRALERGDGPRPRLRLLREGAGFVLRDDTGPTIYRVTRTRADPAPIRRHLTLITRLGRCGAPILTPDGPPLRLDSGQVATRWPAGRPVGPAEARHLGAVLRQLHHSCAPSELPPWDGPGRIRSDLASLDRPAVGDQRSGDRRVPEEILAAIRFRLGAVERMLPPTPGTTLVHGDAHLGNVVSLQGQPLLIDLDDLARGHPAIDQASMLVTCRRFGVGTTRWADFVAGYGAVADRDLLLPLAACRELFLVTWLASRWVASPEIRAEVRHRLATLDGHDAWHLV